MRTGRDIAIATLLGAEEWGIATAALVVEGCIMMRKCHLNTCPVGIATQDIELRKRFNGDADHVVNFFRFIVQELREIMAELGFRTINEMVGQVDCLEPKKDIRHWKYSKLDLSPILYKEPTSLYTGLYKQEEQDHGLDNLLDWKLLKAASPALNGKEKVYATFPIINTDRTAGTILSNEISRKFKSEGLPEDTIHFKFTGSAGQSFGAFVPHGVTMRLYGDANDYFGKGLSGGRLIVRPPLDSPFVAEEQIIAGNVILYGATGGEVFIRGQVGGRFCVRNSGATAVVEGVGDHGCEYMTGGLVVVLGPTGRNFAAGMSGGVAYLLDPDPRRVNTELADLEELPPQDAEFLRDLISRYLAETGSAVAAMLLADWDAAAARFGRVMPKDYKRVLRAASQAEQDGRDVNQAVMAAAHG